MNIFIIVPAYNEEKTIDLVISQLKKIGQVVVVDDFSVDDTKNIAKKSGALVLSHMLNRGQGASLQTGTTYALMNGADIIIHFDADGQHSVDDIDTMIQPIIKKEVDVVLGSRFLCDKSNIPFLRFIVLKMAVLFTRFVSGINVTDTHNGFRALSRFAAKKIKITQDRMAHASEILDEITKNRLIYKEIPVHINYTEYSLQKGQSSFGFFNILKDLFASKILK